MFALRVPPVLVLAPTCDRSPLGTRVVTGADLEPGHLAFDRVVHHGRGIGGVVADPVAVVCLVLNNRPLAEIAGGVVAREEPPARDRWCRGGARRCWDGDRRCRDGDRRCREVTGGTGW